MSDTLKSWIQKLPKAELHLHIEGSLEPEMMFELSKKNKVPIPYKSVEEVRAGYQFHNLQSFLDIYDASSNVLQIEEDFFDLAWAYLKKAQEDNIKHAEIFFDPQTHTARGVSVKTVVSGLSSALDKAKKDLDISSHLILCFLRHLSEEEAIKVFDEALPLREKFVGVGLDSSELGNPPSKFKKVFGRAQAEGLKLVAHAGEEGPPDYIWQALDILKVHRIDHGVRCIEDKALMKRLKEDQTPLTVCPFSNVKLKIFESLSDHNFKTLLEQGLNVSLHSDDPSYFGGYLLDNYVESTEALDLDQAMIKQLLINSFESSFLDDDKKQGFISEIKSA